MWARLLAGLLARPWARRVAGFGLATLTIALFVINLRRQGGFGAWTALGVHR